MFVFANVVVALVALMHAYFLVLEMFLWTKPQGLKTFGNTPEKARETAVLAANQGLYNGFLAAGLLWGLIHPTPAIGFQIKVFFLLCVVVAGLYGGYSVKPKIIYVQAVPALVALLLLWLA
jgi:putative membrane protein